MKKQTRIIAIVLSLILLLTPAAIVNADFSYTVKSGDSLWKIAQELYKDGSQYVKISEKNKDIVKNPNEIFPGQVLVIPDVGVQENASTDETGGSSEAEINVSDLANGDPWINSNIKENVLNAKNINIKDDFYLAANYDWLKSANIPAGKSAYSIVSDVNEKIQKNTEALLKNPETDKNSELVKGYYDSFLNWENRNAAGLTPIKPVYEKIVAAKTLSDITKLISNPETLPYLTILNTFLVDAGLSNPDMYCLYINTPGFVLEDSAEYKTPTELGTMRKNYIHDFFVYMMGRLGVKEAEANAIFENALAFEAEYAELVPTNADMMATDYTEKTNNPMMMGDVVRLAAGYPIREIVDALSGGYDGITYVDCPEYFSQIDKFYNEANVEKIKALMLVGLFDGTEKMFDKESYDKSIELYNKYYNISGKISDETAAFNAVKENLNGPLDQLYIKTYCKESDKERVTEIIHDVIASYKKMLSETDWISEKTRNYAVQKLDSMKIHVGWPENWDDYNDLSLSGKSYFDDYMKVAKYKTKSLTENLGKELGENFWTTWMSLIEINAFYYPSENSINIIAGIMEEPFYSSDMSTEEMMGGIGAVIGHEISHAFDNNGAQFDKDGAFNNWWTDEDLKNFEARIKKVDDYLDTIRVMGDYYVNGSNVDSEAIADFTGVEALLLTAKEIKDFDYDKFFRTYALVWAGLNTYSEALDSLQNDPHPLDYIRGNVTVQQFDEFYKTYDIKPGDGMYLAPENRILVW